MSQGINHDTWRDQWNLYLAAGDYAAAERLVTENLVTDECAAGEHNNCPLDEACKCPHHSQGNEERSVMGTNYYHRTNICPCCGRYDQEHIGKSSGGWQFSFHGIRDVYDEGVKEIRSYADWLARLESEGKGFDEYGVELPLDEFKKMVEAKRAEEFNHTIYCRQHHRDHAKEDCWLDADGYSFDASEFC